MEINKDIPEVKAFIEYANGVSSTHGINGFTIIDDLWFVRMPDALLRINELLNEIYERLIRIEAKLK